MISSGEIEHKASMSNAGAMNNDSSHTSIYLARACVHIHTVLFNPAHICCLVALPRERSTLLLILTVGVSSLQLESDAKLQN